MLAQSGAVALFHVDEYRGADLRAIVDEVRPQAPELRDTLSFADWEAFLAEVGPGYRS